MVVISSCVRAHQCQPSFQMVVFNQATPFSQSLNIIAISQGLCLLSKFTTSLPGVATRWCETVRYGKQEKIAAQPSVWPPWAGWLGPWEVISSITLPLGRITLKPFKWDWWESILFGRPAQKDAAPNSWDSTAAEPQMPSPPAKACGLSSLSLQGSHNARGPALYKGNLK